MRRPCASTPATISPCTDMAPRSTPAGGHNPVMLREAMAALDVGPGDIVVDCTVGAAGHAEELLRRVGPTGRLIGLDLDPSHLESARARLSAIGHPFELHQSNFAGVARLTTGPVSA